jgi:hypothetical protein
MGCTFNANKAVISNHPVYLIRERYLRRICICGVYHKLKLFQKYVPGERTFWLLSGNRQKPLQGMRLSVDFEHIVTLKYKLPTVFASMKNQVPATTENEWLARLRIAGFNSGKALLNTDCYVIRAK